MLTKRPPASDAGAVFGNAVLYIDPKNESKKPTDSSVNPYSLLRYIGNSDFTVVAS